MSTKADHKIGNPSQRRVRLMPSLRRVGWDLDSADCVCELSLIILVFCAGSHDQCSKTIVETGCNQPLTTSHYLNKCLSRGQYSLTSAGEAAP